MTILKRNISASQGEVAEDIMGTPGNAPNCFHVRLLMPLTAHVA